MSGRPTEEDFVNEGMSDEEISALNAEPQQPEPAREPEQVQQQEAPQQAEEPKTVDVRALQEARAEARAAREEAARIRDERARLEERLNILNQSLAEKNKPQEKPAVTYDEDPIAYFKDGIDGSLNKIQELEKRLAERDSFEREQKEVAALMDRGGAILNEAIGKKPETKEAFDFALEGLRQEIATTLRRANVPLEKMQAEGERIWQASLVQMAKRMPQDPEEAAEFVMRNARYYGFSAQPAQQQPVNNNTRPSPQELAARQERHMSLSNIQGGEAPQALTLDQINKMSDEEFNALAKKLGDKGLDRLMGAA